MILKLIKFLIGIIGIVAIACWVIVFFYEVKFTSPNPDYDIILFNRKNPKEGFGVKYKEGLEVWEFKKGQFGGMAESCVWQAQK